MSPAHDENGNLDADLGAVQQPGKATAFSYDGLSRRTAIASTPAGGGGAVTTSYLWCGARICQARNASGAVTREYYSEGEYVPGAPGQPYYYGPDQIGSVRRVFASTSSAPAYSYDPYGNALQGTAHPAHPAWVMDTPLPRWLSFRRRLSECPTTETTTSSSSAPVPPAALWPPG